MRGVYHVTIGKPLPVRPDLAIKDEPLQGVSVLGVIVTAEGEVVVTLKVDNDDIAKAIEGAPLMIAVDVVRGEIDKLRQQFGPRPDAKEPAAYLCSACRAGDHSNHAEQQNVRPCMSRYGKAWCACGDIAKTQTGSAT